ncbi:hypothetical protein [Streptomyces sp. NBC_00223]|uniref:hypothetical protein n=1 Tax=Streptomyces sp. NBC_00223 TaxID=2976008 RepID=UPI002E2B93D6|nr:hypothetical protein [Streptomyces sp. NBC_00223]
MIRSLGDQIFSALIGALVTLVLTWIGRRIQINGTKRMWRLRRPDRLRIVLSTSARIETPTYFRPVTGLGGARALSLLTPSLARAYRIPDGVAMLSSLVEDRDREGDLILLGGPKNNEVTREALARLDRRLPVTMRTEGDEKIYRRTSWNSEDEALPPPSGQAPSHGRAGADYGLIIRAPNCFNSETTLMIFAGQHTYGIIAAAQYFLTHQREMRKMSHRNFALVVKSAVTAKEHVEPPELYCGPFFF